MSGEHMKCPDCAETILREAKKCRFCGRSINKADRLGYPSFYNNILNMGLDCPWAVFEDYAKQANSGRAFPINSSRPLETLLNHGDLDEWAAIDPVNEALWNRYRELQAELDLEDHEELDEAFSTIKNEELKAVRLAFGYSKCCMYFSKLYGEKDLRTDLGNLETILESMEKLRTLSDSADPKMVGFVEQFDHEIAALKTRIEEVKKPPISSSASSNTSEKKKWWQRL